jgi:hypothetical protein
MEDLVQGVLVVFVLGWLYDKYRTYRAEKIRQQHDAIVSGAYLLTVGAAGFQYLWPRVRENLRGPAGVCRCPQPEVAHQQPQPVAAPMVVRQN